MTQTIPVDLMERMDQINLDELEHHGILGMKWGVRRFQKYPAGYHGDGKYIGPDGQPRQPTRKEARRDRKYNELKTKIDKWLVDAVETGDKKKLKVLKKTMTPQEYQSAYDNLVKKGVADAVKSGEKSNLKKYKGDISKKEYKDAKTLSDFNDAVNRMDTKKMNQLVSKIKNEEVKEAAQRIAAMTEFQNKKVSALKVESELSAKLGKAAITAGNVAKLASSAKTVYDVVTGVKKSMEDRQYELMKRADEINKKNTNDAIEKAINSGNVEKIKKLQNKMSNQQLKDAYERMYLNKKEKIDRDILTENTLEKAKNAHLLSYADIGKIKAAQDEDTKYKSRWSKDVQDAKQKKYSDAATRYREMQDELDRTTRRADGKDEINSNKIMRLDTPEEKAAKAKDMKIAKERLPRIQAVEWASEVLYNQASADYKAYAATNPTGQTWTQALTQKSKAIKNTFGTKIEDAKLSPAARQAKRDAEQAALKLKNQDLSDARKIIAAFEKNGEGFLDGSVPFIDPRKFRN